MQIIIGISIGLIIGFIIGFVVAAKLEARFITDEEYNELVNEEDIE
jgi:uncharacterized protein YneF (UPF0154 family)